jgi:pentose-5-phosphate-3-epimerase
MEENIKDTTGENIEQNHEENQDSGLKIEIIPALLPESFEHLEEEINYVKSATLKSAGYVQIDVVDGLFAPTKTWPYNNLEDENWQQLVTQEEGLPQWEKLNFEIDLMVKDQLGAADDWINAGTGRLIGHIEAFDKNFTDDITLEEYTNISSEDGYIIDLDTEKLEAFIKLKEQAGVEIVLSLNPSTKTEVLNDYLEKVDGVQFMGNDKVGYHGVELDEKVLEKISNLRAQNPNLPIGIDIGVKFKTLVPLAEAGITRFSSGSVILNSEDTNKTIDDMLEVIKNR